MTSITRLPASLCLLIAACQWSSVPAPAPQSNTTIREQCLSSARNSAAHCEFLNQRYPEGLAECTKTQAQAVSRCERMGS